MTTACFLDPRAIRLQKGKFAAQANQCTTTFFDEITDCVRSPKKGNKLRGLALLQRFTEPKETRLGYSKRKINGHGGADEVGQAIWDALSTNVRALIVVGVLKFIEDMPVFVDDIAEDRTSDLTTRIVFEPLARFTQSMLHKHPEFTSGSHRTDSFTRQVWDPGRLEWTDKKLVLPVANDKPLMLVPRDWARATLLMSSSRFFDTTMLTFAQERRTVIDKTTGKALKPSKDDLRQESQFARGIDTIIRVAREAQAHDEDLVARFRSFVDGRYEPLSDERIAKRLG
jgi:hypothetical protein